MIVNTLRGLTSVRPSQIELMRSYAAGRGRDLPPRPGADGAAVRLRGIESRDRARDDRRHRERLLRTFGSLGITIKNSVSLFDFETAWAAILVASILGVAMYVAVSLVERYALKWDPTRQERGTA